MRVVIVGGGGQGLIVAETIAAMAAHGTGLTAIGVVDDTPPAVGPAGLPILGGLADLGGIPHDSVVVAIGNNSTRRKVTAMLLAAGEQLCTVRHPFSSIAPDVVVGAGSMISAGAIATPGVILGRCTLLNTKSSVDHGSVLGDFVHVSAGATIGAAVRLGDEVFVAMGATVVSQVSVGARCVIGSGAVVLRDLPPDVSAWGVPARIVKESRNRLID